MKRIVVYLTIAHITFTCGLTAASLWSGTKVKPRNNQNHAASSGPVASVPPPPVEPHRDIVFGDERLRIATHEIRLKSELLRYEIHVSYPEIVGSNDRHIEKLNQHLRELAIDQYQWPMNPSKADLRYYKETRPGDFNTIDFDYEIRLATDSLLSIYFIGYSYGIGAGHSVQYSLTLNYDLTLRRELGLSDIFNPKSKHLEFISRYCTKELLKPRGLGDLFNEPISPRAESFQSWNITGNGLKFNFDECTIAACAWGKRSVEIPFTTLNPLLNSRMVNTLTID